MTATTVRSLPVRRNALAMPSPHERAVEAWEFSTMSWTDSARLG